MTDLCAHVCVLCLHSRVCTFVLVLSCMYLHMYLCDVCAMGLGLVFVCLFLYLCMFLCVHLCVTTVCISVCESVYM